MSLSDWREEPIANKYDRASFDCGEPVLNEFRRRHARQSHEKGAAKTFLAISKADGKTILGFYSLCPASLEYVRAPEIVRKGLARHDVPVFRLGRLAVHLSVQGQGLGGQLILAAGRRCLFAAAQVGGVALLIDAKNEWAAHWYSAYGAIPLLDRVEPLFRRKAGQATFSWKSTRWEKLKETPRKARLGHRGSRRNAGSFTIAQSPITVYAWNA